MRPLLVRIAAFFLRVWPLLYNQRGYPIILKLVQLGRWCLNTAITNLGVVLILHVDEALGFLLVGPAAESDVYVLVVDGEPPVWLVACICVGLRIG